MMGTSSLFKRLAWKSVNRAEVALLSGTGPYRLARAYAVASQGRDDLPGHAEALAVLEAASPRPRGGLHVPPRDWPDSPGVDVSVIVPCYNVEDYVEGCLRSIVTQETRKTLEVISVDDGSTDRTGELLDAMANQDSRIRVIHQDNRGLSGARNTGVAACKGATLVFVDSDDLLTPGALETLSSALWRGGCDYVTATYENMSGDGKVLTPLTGKRTHGAPWARLYSREVWRNLEFPEGFWFEDTVQAFCINPCWRERYIDVPVYLYRHNNKGIMAASNTSKRGLDTLWVVEEMLAWERQLGIPLDQGVYDTLIYQLGPLLWKRTSALTEVERRATFAYASDLFNLHSEGRRLSTSRGGRWPDVDQALKTRNYRQWKVGVLGVG